jgi:hypothetical protein
MVIEKTATEFIIRIPASGDINDIQDFINYLQYRELTAKFLAGPTAVEELVNMTKATWRKKRV